ncbi:hypothetical protein OY671_009332, partial [Metschnikowia pulcherrima]
NRRDNTGQATGQTRRSRCRGAVAGVRFRRGRAFGAAQDPRAPARCAGDLRRRQRRPALWHQDRGADRRARFRPAGPHDRTLSPAPCSHRSQHRLHHRARFGARGAGSADRGHRAGDQAGGGDDTVRRDRPARHRSHDPAGLCRSTGSRIRGGQDPAAPRRAGTGAGDSADLRRLARQRSGHDRDDGDADAPCGRGLYQPS